MFITAVGLNHRTAPVAVREKLSFPESVLKDTLLRFTKLEGVNGGVILSTCNRTEVYTILHREDDVQVIREFLSHYCGVPVDEIKKYLYTYFAREAINHLFKVAAGLDSMVLGETQILGQVKQAYEIAQDVGTVNKVLNKVFQQALAVGKTVRHKTGIDKNPVSISYAAVELARQTLGSLEGRMVLIIGAGKMSELTVKHLIANGISGVIVSNRSFDRAVELAAHFGGRAVRFDEVYHWMKRADIVISCTAATHYVVKAEPLQAVMRKRKGKKIFLIDIAVPRDIDPAVGQIPGVSLYDIDSLQSVVDANLAERRRAASVAEDIIDDEVDKIACSLSTGYVIPTVVALKELGETIKEKELQKALNRLGDLSDREIKIICSLANSLVNQLLHMPVTNLKAYAHTPEGHLLKNAVEKLFALEIEEEDDDTVISKEGKASV
ncbi:MAG: glutamyl-tRNA reductase [Peptococcaceae bacterium]|nr:glutamyl-tRNA reductase [Peptococcaceae bacterium]